MPTTISKLTARQILDSRGTPTIECTCHLTNNKTAIAAVPSGASTGKHEAVELRDHDPTKYLGFSVYTAINNISQTLSPIASGKDPTDIFSIDQKFIEADGTQNKSNLGANAILAASKAITRAGALTQNLPLYTHLRNIAGNDQPLSIPIPFFNLINGGLHAGMNLDFQEFIITPNPEKIPHYPDQLAACSSIFHRLRDILSENRLPISVGDEGGFAPVLDFNFLAIDLLAQATSRVELEFTQDIFLALDLAANTFFKDDHYHLKDSSNPLKLPEYFQFLKSLIDKYHPYSLEDPFEEDNWDAWQSFTKKFGDQTIVVGDDLLVTNVNRLQKAIDTKACNAILIKSNQVGTISETISAVNLAKKAGFKTITSHRSGETNDDFIADFAVGVGTDLVKFGAPNRGERLAKYNRLLQIHQELVSSN